MRLKVAIITTETIEYPSSEAYIFPCHITEVLSIDAIQMPEILLMAKKHGSPYNLVVQYKFRKQRVKSGIKVRKPALGRATFACLALHWYSRLTLRCSYSCIAQCTLMMSVCVIHVYVAIMNRYLLTSCFITFARHMLVWWSPRCAQMNVWDT